MVNNYAIFISEGNEDYDTYYRFPVNPSEINWKTAGKLDIVDMLGVGNVAYVRPSDPTRVSWQSFFPNEQLIEAPYSTVKNTAKNYLSPRDWWIMLNDWQWRGQDLYLTIYRKVGDTEFYKTSTPVVINDFTKIEKGGEEGDVYYEIDFCFNQTHSTRWLTTGIEGVMIDNRLPPVPSNIVKIGDTVLVQGKLRQTFELVNAIYSPANNERMIVKRMEGDELFVAQEDDTGEWVNWGLVKKSQVSKEV